MECTTKDYQELDVPESLCSPRTLSRSSVPLCASPVQSGENEGDGAVDERRRVEYRRFGHAEG